MADNGGDCREKYHKVLECLKTDSKLQDDTFLEKIHTYLATDGKFHNDRTYLRANYLYLP
jgi:hypothetical protein